MSGRFSRCPAAAVFDSSIPDRSLRILAAIGVYADQNGKAFPSIKTLATRLGLGQRTIRNHLRALEAAGYVVTERSTRQRGGYGSNHYTLAYPEIGPLTTGNPEMPIVEPDSENDRQPIGADRDRQPRDAATTGNTGLPPNSPFNTPTSLEQPNRESRDVFEEMFAELLPRISRSSFEVGATIIETEPAEPKLLGKMTELVEKAEPSREAPQPAEPAVPAEPLPVPPEPKPFDPAQYHNIVADKITRWCGVGIGQAWAFMLDMPDSTVVDLCRKVHDGKLRKADVTKALKAAQALKAQAAE